jgi:hypothetical protein
VVEKLRQTGHGRATWWPRNGRFYGQVQERLVVEKLPDRAPAVPRWWPAAPAHAIINGRFWSGPGAPGGAGPGPETAVSAVRSGSATAASRGRALPGEAARSGSVGALALAICFLAACRATVKRRGLCAVHRKRRATDRAGFIMAL